MNQSIHHSGVASRPSTMRCWLMWGIAAIFYCYENFLQVSPNVMNDDLRQAFQLSAEQMGHLGSWYFYAYALMQIPVGLLIDRYGVKPLLSSAVLVCALGSLVFGLARTFELACIGRFLIGFGSAFAVVACMQIAAVWLPPKRFAMITGATLTLGMLGAVGAQVPLHALLAWMDWRCTMYLFAGVGALLAVAVLMVLVDKPKVDQSHKAVSVDLPWWSDTKTALSSGRVWLIAIYAALIFVVTPVFGGLWGASFLIRTLEITEAQAAHMVQYLFIGWAIGAPLFGWFSDRIQRRLPPMYMGSVGTLLALVALIYWGGLPHMVYAVLLFVMGFFCSGFLPSFSIIRDICPARYRATSIGFANTLNMFAPAVINIFVGWVLDRQWDGSMDAGIRVYDAGAYSQAMFILPLCVALSILLLPWIKESYGKQHEVV